MAPHAAASCFSAPRATGRHRHVSSSRPYMHLPYRSRPSAPAAGAYHPPHLLCTLSHDSEHGHCQTPETPRHAARPAKGVMSGRIQKDELASLNRKFRSNLATAVANHAAEIEERRVKKHHGWRVSNDTSIDEPLTRKPLARNLFGTSLLRGPPQPFADIDPEKRGPDPFVVDRQRPTITFMIPSMPIVQQQPASKNYMIPSLPKGHATLLPPLPSAFGFGSVPPSLDNNKYQPKKSQPPSLLSSTGSQEKDGPSRSRDLSLARGGNCGYNNTKTKYQEKAELGGRGQHMDLTSSPRMPALNGLKISERQKGFAIWEDEDAREEDREDGNGDGDTGEEAQA